MTVNVSRYCTSLTAKDSRGATKKKSKAATLRNAANAAGPRPHFSATSTVPSKKSMTILARSKNRSSGKASKVTATLLPTDQA